jgi:S1-C subfamily serine protease
MSKCHKRLLRALLVLGTSAWLAGCDQAPVERMPDEWKVVAPEAVAIEPPPPSSALKYPRPPESLAEMNPAGLFHLRDGVSVKLRERNPRLDATGFGRKAIELAESNTRKLSAFPMWRALTGDEIWRLAERFSASQKDSERVLCFQLLSHAARKNHANAQASLATCYTFGQGVRRDDKAAAFWASKATQNGSGRGAYILSECYRTGSGVEKDLGKARDFLTLAALRNHIYAQLALGCELLGPALSLGYNYGFKRNAAEGRKWVEAVATYPISDQTATHMKDLKAWGLNGLGVMHATGTAVPKNETEALGYYYLAKSLAERADLLKIIDENIVASERNMTSSARQYAQLRAQELRPTYFGTPQASPPPKAERRIAFGSGVFITPNGHLLTAAHVVGNARRVKAQVGENVLDAEIVAVDQPNDVALLKVNAEVDAVPVRPSAGVALGDRVFTIGFPNRQLQGTEPKFTEGTISSTSGAQDDPRQFQVSVQVQPGNSGGALFDENGNVVGIIVARLDDETTAQLTGSAPQNVNYAVKSSYALPLIESLKAELAAEQSPSWFGPKREEIVSKAKHASVPLVVELRTASE